MCPNVLINNCRRVSKEVRLKYILYAISLILIITIISIYIVKNITLKANTQCKYDVILRRVRKSLLQWKSDKSYMFALCACVCVWLCVCVCARARARARGCMRVDARTRGCVHACACVALLIQHAMCVRHIVKSFVAYLSPPHFSTLFHKRHDFRKNVTDHKMGVLIFSTTFV
jgi:hypothetical protein